MATEARRKFEIHQTYHVDPERQQLVGTSQFESDRFDNDEDRTFQRVYERASRIDTRSPWLRGTGE